VSPPPATDRLFGALRFLFVRVIHVDAPGLHERNLRSLRCTVGGAKGRRQRAAPNRRNRSGKGPDARSNGGCRQPAQPAQCGNTAGGDGVTARSIGETAPARARTVHLMGLSTRRSTAESAAIEDIPSSMQTKETTP